MQTRTMVNTAYLASTVVTALLGVGVVALALRSRRWHHYVPLAAYREVGADGSRPTSGLAQIAGRTSTWTALYVVLVLGFMIAPMVYASGAITGPAVIGAVGALVALYLVGGVYVALREHGRPSAQAAAGSAVATGMLFVLAITVLLVMS
ncbi:hypothetical protein [Halosimplex amylolyticum]|uniref:hypothetical protein n=1 Tax=Halosimplex amylolyticum TaxID=3396616 RepID=UPI003F55B62B